MVIFFAFFVILISKAHSNPLVGEPHYCSQEGEQVQVSSALLGKDSCLMCFCKNHMVQCHPSHCPSVEGCYRLQPRPRPECCRTCLGCIHKNKEVPHGHSWQEDCRYYECQAGVLTSSEIKCHTPCSNPQPTLPGECCPRCKECWLEGRPVSAGVTVSPRLDPCVKCTCFGGELTCKKKSCPVLSCPPSKALLDSDGCCPYCNGSRVNYQIPERCFLGRSFYKTGENLTFDQCTTCTCQSGYQSCKRTTCPPLRCPERYRQTESGECCPKCVYPTRSQVCLNEGVLREHGDSWHLDKCSTCTCSHGRVTCQVDYCEYVNKECPVGFRKEKLEEDCCPRCVEEPGVCVTYGDPHYKTFDNYLFNFQGECRYELAKDCKKKSFSVRVNNDARRSSYFSWTRSLSLNVKIGQRRVKISLGQRLRTKVNKKRVKLPHREQGINITREGYLVKVQMSAGVEVTWDGASYVEIKVDPVWRNQTCGLCGNFNREPLDDRKTKMGELAITDEDMANSWQSGKARACSRRLRRLRVQKGGGRTERLSCPNSQKESRLRCQVLNHTIFNECREKVPVDSFYKSCLLDLCECPSSRMCECDAILAFVRECERARVDVSGWRKVSKCGGFECPYGSMYMDCAPACRPSCKNQTPNPSCHMKRCKPGCYCPPPTVLHRRSCILPENCPKKKNKRKG